MYNQNSQLIGEGPTDVEDAPAPAHQNLIFTGLLEVALTPAVKFLELIFRNKILSLILAKCVRDEKYSGTSPPTSPNGSNILDAVGFSVLRCTL